MTPAIKQNYSLKELNTFHIDVKAKYFIEIGDLVQLKEFVKNGLSQFQSFFILGGGSNLLFINDFDGIVIYPKIKGIDLINEDNNDVYIKAMCGENWDEFVEYCVNRGYGGIENLSNIPGNVGATPIQNIGAYGVEAKDVIEKVKTIDVYTGKEVEFSNVDCKFGYRNSIFKNKLKGKYIVTEVIFKLSKRPKLVTTYGKVEEELKKLGERNVSNLRKAIIKIRDEKLPDHNIIGNAGSFFKNPEISIDQYNEFKKRFSNCPSYPLNNKKVKIPAAWLIQKGGWKGKREGDVGVYPKQPLVLVNYWNATGKQIFDLSERIKNSVYNKFGIKLEREVTIVNSY